MKKNILLILVTAMFVFTSCTSQKKIESDDDFSVEAESGESTDESASTDDLSIDGLEEDKPADAAAAEPGVGDEMSLDEPAQKGTAEPAAPDNDLALENELNSLDSPQAGQNQAAGKTDELSLEEPAQAAGPKVPETLSEPEAPQEVNVGQTPPASADATVAAPPPEIPAEQAPAAPPEVTIADATVAEPTVTANITSVQYKGNVNGGTVAITGDQPMKFTTRLNPTTNQFVVEVQNSLIPKKLKRSLNTKDMASSIGSVDIYQKEGSNIARFVVQLRQGATEPIVQPEGNSLLIIGAATDPASVQQAAASSSSSGSDATPPQAAPEGSMALTDDPIEKATAEPVEAETNRVEVLAKETVEQPANSAETAAATKPVLNPVSGLLSYDDLEDFLMSNTKFYGKKIAIETSDMKLGDFIKFLSEESGVNIIMDEGIAELGRVNIKLKEVPWDQAFVLVLKTKKLAYKRQGNVIRVARLDDIKKDENEAIALKESRKVREPLIVKRFFIGYAELPDISKKITDYMALLETSKTGVTAATASTSTSTGKVITDARTNSLIITDTEDNLKKIEKIILALDTQPQQVMIEGKFVDAKESFARGLGIQWESGTPPAGNTNTGGIRIAPAVTTSPSVLTTNFTWGQVDFLGSLTATLQLGESQSKVKVLSSPRITVLSSQSATINQNTSIQIPTTTTVDPTSGRVTTSFETKNVGIGLSVTPIATNEGTVNLNLSINRSFQSGATGTDSRSANTRMIVRSGQTAVVGGIYESSVEETESGVPGLSSVPVLGRLFKSEQFEKSKSELLIFVTPTILKPVVTR